MRQILLGKAPLGQGGAVGNKPRFLGPPYYLVNDTFTTDRAAGAVNGTRAEPGPGLRTVTDGNSKLSLSGGSVVVASAAPASGNPNLLYGLAERAAGKMVLVQITPVAGNAPGRCGWTGASQTGSDVVFLNSSGVIGSTINGANGPTLGTWAGATSYVFAVIQRANGLCYFVKGGAFSNWTLLWVANVTSTGERSPIIAAVSNGAGFSSEYLRVPAALWLPTPLASDGFSAWGTSDGLGHAEGVAGGLGSGGNGLAWTNQIGTFGATGGVAQASALSGGIAAATVDTSKTDTLVTAKVARSGGVAGVLAAYVDADNHILAVHNGTNAQLIKRVSGSDTNVISAAATYSAGAEIRVIREGTAYRLYYNNALIGSQQTISDAVFNGVTTQGLYTTDSDNTLDDFTVYARGTGGEYAALDNY